MITKPKPTRRYYATRKVFPSLAEVKQAPQWPVWNEIFLRYDFKTQKVIIRRVVEQAAAQYGGVFEDVAEANPRDFVRSFVEAFCFFHGSGEGVMVDELAEVQRIREFLDDVEAELFSYAQKKHTLIAELRRASMPWSHIAALITEGWDALETDERDSKTASLKASHKSYVKKYAPENTKSA